MSAMPAVGTTTSMRGNTALAPSSTRTQSTHPRSPLAVVPAPAKRRRPPLAVWIMLILVAAMATVLTVNIAVSSSQYQLVELKSQRDKLVESNQSLTQQADNYAAPSNLYQQASQLGMTVGTSVGSIDVEKGSVTGNPEPAVKADPLRNLMGAPAVILDGTKPQSASSVEEKPAEGADKEKKDDAPAAAEPKPADLNGGSIPAPKQR